MEGFIRYVTDVAAIDPGGELKPVYGVIPGMPLEERELPHLPGYRGFGPVRIGNAAALQTQNDGYGNVVLAATQMFFDRRLPKPGGLDLFHRLEQLGERAIACAFLPDAGLWEFRGRARTSTLWLDRHVRRKQPATGWPRSPTCWACRSARNIGVWRGP